MFGTVHARPTRLAGPQDFTEQSIVLRKIDQALRAKFGAPESKPAKPPWHTTQVFPMPSYYQFIHAPKAQGPTTPPPWVVIPWNPHTSVVGIPYPLWDWLVDQWDTLVWPYFADFCLVQWGNNDILPHNTTFYTGEGMALFYLPGMSQAWTVSLLADGVRLIPGMVSVSLPGQPAPAPPW